MKDQIQWDADADIGETYRVGELELDYLSFEELVGRLKTLSGQEPSEGSDGDKLSVEFIGRFAGQAFTLYDWKGDDAMHIGARHSFDIWSFRAALKKALNAVEPSSYVAARHFEDADGTTHGWPR